MFKISIINTRSSQTNNFLLRFNNKSGHKLLAYQGSKLCLKNQNSFGKFKDEIKIYLLNSVYQGRSDHCNCLMYFCLES